MVHACVSLLSHKIRCTVGRKGRINRTGQYVTVSRHVGVHTTFWLGGLKGGDHEEDLGVDGRTTLRWILGK
jgi:hypothetical protein